ncbi:hypothetical protein ABU614_08345 [Lysobacter firmicutimachus]|uniref:Lipoprotein n=1 Tax=Lysobacter firmicutimachus TaxID=1792846 RepID=A0AAU8MW05_9GAMM|nr:hypothetical protein [Lysobacter antibioticus]
MIAVAALGALAGCTKPQPPDKERPVEPQATQLRDAIQQPIDQAKGSEDAVDQGAQRQRDAIEAAGG